MKVLGSNIFISGLLTFPTQCLLSLSLYNFLCTCTSPSCNHHPNLTYHWLGVRNQNTLFLLLLLLSMCHPVVICIYEMPTSVNGGNLISISCHYSESTSSSPLSFLQQYDLLSASAELRESYTGKGSATITQATLHSRARVLPP